MLAFLWKREFFANFFISMIVRYPSPLFTGNNKGFISTGKIRRRIPVVSASINIAVLVGAQRFQADFQG